MASPLTRVSNRIAAQAKSGWQWVDAKLRPFPQHLGPVFAEHYARIEKSQRWDAAKLAKLQDEKLATLIEHSYTNVPYYTKVMDERGLKPRDIRSVGDLPKLPILTKQLIRDNYDSLIAKGAEKEYWIESHTSGSTGKPLAFLLDSDAYLRELAYTVRAWTFGSYKLGDPIIVLRSYVPKPGQPLHYHDRRNNFHYLSAYHLTPEVMREYVQIINKSGASVLRGYPSSLYIFCKFLLEQGIRLPKIDTAITSSEMLLPIYRETISAAIGGPVLDWYGCNERIATISQCQVNQGYHTNSEYGVLEVIDESGKNIEAGEGAVIGTTLDNRTMPLIRYAPDDRVTIQKASVCSCGRGLPLQVTSISGRSDEILDFGTMMIPPINFYTMFHEIHGVKQFQLVQTARHDLTAKLVVDADFGETARQAVQEGLQSRVGAKTKIDIQICDEIPRDPKTGKVRAILNQVS